MRLNSIATIRSMMLQIALMGVVWLGLGAASSAAEPIETGFVSKTFHDEDGAHEYVVWVPAEYDPHRPWPVMLFLHGAGERGSDGLAQTRFGLGPMIKRWGGFPWIVVFPQAEDQRIAIEKTWSPNADDGRRALAILEQVESDYHTDPRHRVLTGWSMGGHGCYLMAARYPEKWTAVAPLAGWADVELAKSLVDVPIWAFHGVADPLVPIEEDAALIAAIEQGGGDPFFTKLPGRGHSIWRSVYAFPELFAWMSNPARLADRADPPPFNPDPAIEMDSNEAQGPFVPELIVRDAVVIRAGPEVFEDVSRIATEQIVKTPFQGTVPGTGTITSVLGIPIQVTTSPIDYHVPVVEVDVRPTARGTLHVRAAVAGAHATIRRTDIRGWLCSAVAGPMTIWLGYRRPLIVEAEVEPYIEDDAFRVRTRNVDLTIPADNWCVSRPGVYSQFLSDQRVSQSLVEGVYSNKTSIEQSLREAIAKALDELSFEMPAVSDDQLLTGLWPMPAYRPRARPIPERLVIDESGMAVVFSLVIAALDPWSNPVPREIEFQLTTRDLEGDIAIEAAQGLLKLLSAQMISAGVAHINVLDVPVPGFKDLADKQVMARAIPAIADLPPEAELRTELYLRQPLMLNESGRPVAACDEHGCYTIFELSVPKLVAVISVRNAPSQPWREWAELEYAIRQSVRLEVGLELKNGREVISKAEGPPRIRVEPHWIGEKPANTQFNEQVAKELLSSRWVDWWDPIHPTAIVIPDLEFRGYSRRLDRLVPGEQGMVAIFEKAETVITNRSTEPLTYQIRHDNDQWSTTLILPPGERHVYRVPRSLGYKSTMNSVTERYEIPPGRDASFKKRDNGRLGLVMEALPKPLREQGQIPGTGW